MRILLTFEDTTPTAGQAVATYRELVEVFNDRDDVTLLDIRDDVRNPEHFLPPPVEIQAKAEELFRFVLQQSKPTDMVSARWLGVLRGRIEALLWVLLGGEL